MNHICNNLFSLFHFISLFLVPNIKRNQASYYEESQFKTDRWLAIWKAKSILTTKLAMNWWLHLFLKKIRVVVWKFDLRATVYFFSKSMCKQVIYGCDILKRCQTCDIRFETRGWYYSLELLDIYLKTRGYFETL